MEGSSYFESMGQEFYKLDNDDHQYLRADIYLIKKGPAREARPPLPPPAGDDDDDPNVPKDVNARRNIKMDDDKREVDPPKVKKETKPPDWDASNKLSKKDWGKSVGKNKKGNGKGRKKGKT